MKITVKSIGKAAAAGLVLLALAALASGIVTAVTGSGFAAAFWRICAGLDGVVCLMIAVFLLTHRSPGKSAFSAWEKYVPNLSILGALLIVALLLTAAACLANYLIV